MLSPLILSEAALSPKVATRSPALLSLAAQHQVKLLTRPFSKKILLLVPDNPKLGHSKAQSITQTRWLQALQQITTVLRIAP